MDTMKRSVWVRGVVLVAAVAAAACSSGPCPPTGVCRPPTVTPTVTPTPCTASAPQPMTSFTAEPATITDGDAFTLRWAAPCGFVSLAQKGKGPFTTLQPSTGSYALQTGQAGYPTATGNTVYEARNADTATPLEATLTVNPGLSTPGPTPKPTPSGTATPTPAPTPTPSGCPGGCDDHNPCTTDTCVGTTCQHSAANNGAVCSGTCGICSGGSCVDDASRCNDSNPCTNDSCSGGTCSNTAIRPCCGNGACESGEKCSCWQDCTGQTCNDGTACTHDDRCLSNGTCAGTAYAHCPGTPCSNGNHCVTSEVWQADGVTCGGGTNVPAGPPYTVCQGTCGVCNGYGSCIDMPSMCTGDIRCVTCVSGTCGCKPYDPSGPACGGSGSGAQYCHNCSCY